MDVVFVCPFFDCYREFTNKKSFRKHHKSDHSKHSFLSVSNVPDLEDVPENNENCFEELQVSHFLVGNSNKALTMNNLPDPLKYALSRYLKYY